MSTQKVGIFFAVAIFAISATSAQAFGLTEIHDNDVQVQAASALGDIRQGAGQASDHTIEFTLDGETNIDIGEDVVVTWSSGSDAGEHFNFANITAADIIVYVDGVAVTPTTDYTAVITTVPVAGTDGVMTISAVTAFASAGSEMSIVIGNGATLTGTGNQIINPTVASEDAHVNETDLGEENFYKITVSGDFGTEGGVSHSVKSALVYPILNDDQVHVYAYVMPQLTFNLDSGDTSYVNGNNTSLLGACTGIVDDDDQTCDFFDAYANSIDFGMPVTTATTFATPTHPTYVMDGGNATATLGTDGVATNGGAHSFHVGTNAVNGLVTTVWGETLTHSNNVDTIAATGAPVAPLLATDQFGFCLAQDDAGVDGTDATVVPSGAGDVNAGLGADAADCATNTYGFNPTVDGAAVPVLNEIAISNAPTTLTWFDMEYMVNIDAATPAGVYSTDLTFVTTGLF